MLLFLVASGNMQLQLIYQSLVLTNIQHIIARIKCIRLSFFIAWCLDICHHLLRIIL